MKTTFYTLLALSCLTLSACADTAYQPATTDTPMEKVVDVQDNSMVNPDGTAVTTRKVVTETANPAMRPAGVPAYAKAQNRTVTTTSIVHPSDMAVCPGARHPRHNNQHFSSNHHCAHP